MQAAEYKFHGRNSYGNTRGTFTLEFQALTD